MQRNLSSSLIFIPTYFARVSFHFRYALNFNPTLSVSLDKGDAKTSVVLLEEKKKSSISGKQVLNNRAVAAIENKH